MNIIESAISELSRKINDLRLMGIPPFIPRNTEVLSAPRLVSVLAGPRRCGKTFRTYQEISQLIDSNWLAGIEHVCAIDFDNPHFSKLSATDLGTMRDTFLGMTQSANLRMNLLFVFDEIHRIEGWEEFVVDLSRNVSWRVMVTGSSSRLLVSDISTSLRGKSIATTLYPLSFIEYLRFRDIEPIDSTVGRAAVKAAFSEYLEWGGFPQVAQTQLRVREALLREYFDTMILKDIIQRHNITRPRQCIALYRYLLSLIGKPYTLNSALKYLRQSGTPATASHIADYAGWADDAWFLFGAPVFTDSQAEIDRNYRKCYCVDWALAIQNSQVWDGTYSRAFENLIYMHLRRTYPRVNYYLTRRQRREVDFICIDSHGKPLTAVQACLKIGDGSVLDRELPGLVSSAKYFGITNALVVTMEEERIIELDGVRVRIVPAWRWMVEE
ncbi:MAG: AAA family ATPase [Candidatus Lokiarchaeota archaeon]|nr:AAA family ATPase [Candidatus Lokiarchaeota archaeon]